MGLGQAHTSMFILMKVKCLHKDRKVILLNQGCHMCS